MFTFFITTFSLGGKIMDYDTWEQITFDMTMRGIENLEEYLDTIDDEKEQAQIAFYEKDR